MLLRVRGYPRCVFDFEERLGLVLLPTPIPNSFAKGSLKRPPSLVVVLVYSIPVLPTGRWTTWSNRIGYSIEPSHHVIVLLGAMPVCVSPVPRKPG